MGADVVQAQYEQLDTVALRFADHARSHANLLAELKRSLAALQKGGWQGRGADAFFKEMNEKVLPSVSRLAEALEHARKITVEIKGLVQAADEEAARPFRSEGATASPVIHEAMGEAEGSDSANHGEGKPSEPGRHNGSRISTRSYVVSALVQPKPNACWATVATMLVSWHEQSSLSIPEVMNRAGAQYQKMFGDDTGLAGEDKATFLQALNLQIEPPMGYTVQGLAEKLQKYGPLWVTTDEAPGAGFSPHARIITKISGDGTVNGTRIRFTDPADGSTYTESFHKFVRKFEDVAVKDRAANREFRIQVTHFPARK